VLPQLNLRFLPILAFSVLLLSYCSSSKVIHIELSQDQLYLQEEAVELKELEETLKELSESLSEEELSSYKIHLQVHQEADLGMLTDIKVILRKCKFLSVVYIP
jgi:biopolymer transport protein ExbD